MKRRSRAGSTTSNTHRRKRPTPKRSGPLKAVSRGRSTATGQVTEMAHLARERDEALEREKATAEVLRVISSSPGALEPVFEAMLENATRMCEAKFGGLWLREDAQLPNGRDARPAAGISRKDSRPEPLFKPVRRCQLPEPQVRGNQFTFPICAKMHPFSPANRSPRPASNSATFAPWCLCRC